MSRRRSRGEGTLVQLPSGSWRAQVCIDRKRLSITKKTRGEAREWVREMQEKISLGMTYEASQTRLSQFMENWLRVKRYSIRPATDRQYSDAVRIYILPSLGELKLIDITPKTIQAFIDSLSDAHVGRRTIQIVRLILHSCLQHAVDLAVIKYNPVEIVKAPKSDKRDLQVWNEDEVSLFLRSIEGERNENFYYLALTTGMRQGELLGLKWPDIEWKRGVIMVKRQAVRVRGGGYGFAEPKSKRGRRVVDLGIGSIEKLRTQYELINIGRQAMKESWTENELVFPTKRGTPQEGTNIDREFKRLVAQAGLPKIRFHDLRHTAASILLSRGIPPVMIAEMLGHTMGVLLSTYAHFIPSDQSEAARVMDEVTAPILVKIDGGSYGSQKNKAAG